MASNFTPEDNTRVSGIETNVQNNSNNIQAVNSYAQGIDNRNFVKYTVNQFVKNGCQIDKVTGELKISISKGASTESRYWVEGIMRTIEDGVEASVQANTSGSIRIDSIYVTSDGGLGVQLGIAGSGSAPTVPDNAMKIYELSIPTGTTSDLSGASLIDLRVYYAYTDTLPESGQFVGQYMVSGETIYLWNGSDWVSQNIEIEQMAMTEAEFQANQEQNKSQYVASGFVEWGKDFSAGNVINTGLWEQVGSNWLNSLMMGRKESFLHGDSKKDSPLLCINGIKIDLDFINFVNSTTPVQMFFKPANNTKSERQDFSFPEKWTELISEKDFVYPRGLVQNQATSYEGIALNTVGAPAASYSAFGAWDTTSPQGKGLRWSTMTQEQKNIFLSDPLNNIRLTENGLVQERVRIRTIPATHNGEWYNTDTSSYLQPEATSYVVAQGSSVSIASDISTTQSDGFAGKDQIDTLENGEWYNASKECYAIPIATVQRLNKGAYDPLYNPAGTAKYSDSNDWWETAITRSEANCFISQVGGNFSSGVSGRPDGKYHDVIYADLVKDERNSSKIQNYTELLEAMKRKLLNGTMRGWEAEKQIQELNSPRSNIAYYYGNGYFALYLTPSAANLVNIHDSVMLLLDSGEYALGVFARVEFNTGIVYMQAVKNTITAPIGYMPVSTYPGHYKFSLPAEIQAETILQCDIIGDPTGTNYPSAGFAGVPNLVDVNDPSVSQLPVDIALTSGQYKNFRLSRKSSSIKKVYVDKTDTGVLVEYASGSASTANQYAYSVTSNCVYINQTASGANDNMIVYVMYETKSYALESDVNNDVLEFDKFALAASLVSPTAWSEIIQECLNKIALGSASSRRQNRILTDYYIDFGTSEKFYTDSVGYLLKHIAFDLSTAASNAANCKFIFYITKTDNQRLKLQVVFKEMIYDTTWGDNDQFEIADNVETFTDDNGNTGKRGQKSIPLPYFDNFKN